MKGQGVFGEQRSVYLCGRVGNEATDEGWPLDGKGLDSHTQEDRPSCLLGRYTYR